MGKEEAGSERKVGTIRVFNRSRLERLIRRLERERRLGRLVKRLERLIRRLERTEA